MSEEEQFQGLAPGMTSVRLGTAYLAPEAGEKNHYGLYRKLVTVANEGGQIKRFEGAAIGPLAIYRPARKGDRVEMKTVHPKTGQPIDLALEWKPAPAKVGGIMDDNL